MQRRLSLFFILLGSWALPMQAQDTLFTLAQDQVPFKLGLGVGVLEDTTQAYTLAQALAQPFTPSAEASISFGPKASSDYWLKFDVLNPEDRAASWLLSFNYTPLDRIRFTLLQGDSIVEQGLYGDQLPFTERSVRYRKPTIPLSLEPETRYTVVLNIHTESSYQLSMQMAEETSFFRQILNEETFFGLIYGIFLIMMVYNLLVFVTLRDWDYVWYALAIGAVGFFFVCYYGHGYQYLWPQAIFFNDRSLHFAMGLIALTNPTFARRFLNLKQYAPFFNWWCHIGFFLGFGVILLSFLAPYSFNAIWVTRIVLLTIPAVFIGAFIAWAKGNKSARFFAIAWVPFLLGGATLMLVNFGILPSNGITTNGLILGSTLQVALLSLALGDRYRLIKAEQAKQQEQQARLLEQMVMERTQELRESNEELSVTLETIQEQKEDILKKNEKITDSIRYASLIQNAMLPLNERLQKGFPEHFVFFKPRDIVSGDFYWYQEQDGKQFAAVVDCTGHGVPGALMSMIGANVLNILVNQHQLTEPGKILELMHEEVERALKQKDTQNRDGMDAAILVWDPSVRQLQYAGARNSLLYFHGQQPEEIKADRRSIAGRVLRKTKDAHVTPFTTHTLTITDPINCYLYSDGYQDQFGGEKGRKLMRKGFFTLLGSLQDQPMTAQKEALEAHFSDWTSQHSQVDDVLVMGLRIG